MKKYLNDIIFIIALTAILLLLSETGNLGYLNKFPFITILIAYFIGKYVGGKSKTSPIKT